MFSKKDLKDNDIVYYRSGEKRIVEKGLLYDELGDVCNNLRYYSNNLKYTSEIALDIVKVERLESTIIYERKEILSKKEREYLSNVINPFKEKVLLIVKKSDSKDDEFIKINFENDISMYFPNFKSGTKYKNMLLDKYYTLEELELN